MKKSFPILILVFLFTGIYGCTGKEAPALHSRYYSVMGGIILEIKLYGTEENTSKIADKIYKQVEEVDKTCNIYKPETELSRLNASAYSAPFKCSPLLWKLMIISKHYYDLTDGAFDISETPLLKLWGFYRKRKQLPTAAETAKAKEKVGLDKVIFDMKNHTVKFTVQGMRLDLGGIAKGFAVQKAAEYAKKIGVKRGIINLSGNAYCFQEPFPGRKNYIIGVKNPLRKNAICGKVKILDQSVATSGDYERFVIINGKHYAHIMNPETGKPVENMLAVTVITPDAADADALSTSVFIKGEKFAKKIMDEIPGTSFLIIRKNKSGIPTMKKLGTCWENCTL